MSEPISTHDQQASQWVRTEYTPRLHSTVSIETANSRRTARVIATKPGWMLLQWHI